MVLPNECVEMLLGADGKALATAGFEGVNVVPVSSVRMHGDTILLVNYFFSQTLTNINENPNVSLAFWKGLSGYRVTATAEHITEGPVFDDVVAWIGKTIPDRVVKGVLMLTPEKLFDISAGEGAGKRIDIG